LNPRVIALASTSRGVVQSSEEKLACSFFKQTKEACEQADIPQTIRKRDQLPYSLAIFLP